VLLPRLAVLLLEVRPALALLPRAFATLPPLLFARLAVDDRPPPRAAVFEPVDVLPLPCFERPAEAPRFAGVLLAAPPVALLVEEGLDERFAPEALFAPARAPLLEPAPALRAINLKKRLVPPPPTVS
jgi:hypothetical protein